MDKAVIGLGFGDEGKGLVTDYLCSLNPSIVVRFSGGQQAGHTVVTKENRHVFSNFGSGTMRNAPSCWAEYCTIDPMAIVKELAILKQKGFEPLLYICGDCPVTTPYDILANRTNAANISHGSCGVGINTTLKRERDNYHLKFSDLFNSKILNIRMNLISEYYNDYKKYYTSWLEYNEIALKDFILSCNFITNSFNIKLIKEKLDFNPEMGIVFEGSQGLLLDKDIGFFPHVTPSNTGTKNIRGRDLEVFYVTRAYQTRHGNGPMTNEELEHDIVLDKEETNVTNQYQGNFRISVLDLDLLIYGLSKDGGTEKYKSNLVVTCLDNIKGDFQFTYKNTLFRFQTKEDFLSKIKEIFLGNEIKFENVYYNESPIGNLKTSL